VIFRNEHFSPPAVGGALGEAEREEYMKVRWSTTWAYSSADAPIRFIIFSWPAATTCLVAQGRGFYYLEG
jgi:hypothetical protein